MSVVLLDVCKSFVYPTPFELHYSNAHLQMCKDNLSKYCEAMNGVDMDLAAHFTIIKEVGYSVIGEPIGKVFGNVPENDYLDSIKSDVENALRDVTQNPVYTILNLCRVLAYQKEGLVLSKEQGGIWGIYNLPKRYWELVEKAVECYQSAKNKDEKYFHRELSAKFCNYMLERIFNE